MLKKIFFVIAAAAVFPLIGFVASAAAIELSNTVDILTSEGCSGGWNVADGVSYTAFSCDYFSEEQKPSLTIDFKRGVDINSITVDWVQKSSDISYEYELAVSDDGIYYTKIFCGADSLYTQSDDHSYTKRTNNSFSGGVFARFVRITVLNRICVDSELPTQLIREIKIYGEYSGVYNLLNDIRVEVYPHDTAACSVKYGDCSATHFDGDINSGAMVIDLGRSCLVEELVLDLKLSDSDFDLNNIYAIELADDISFENSKIISSKDGVLLLNDGKDAVTIHRAGGIYARCIRLLFDEGCPFGKYSITVNGKENDKLIDVSYEKIGLGAVRIDDVLQKDRAVYFSRKYERVFAWDSFTRMFPCKNMIRYDDDGGMEIMLSSLEPGEKIEINLISDSAYIYSLSEEVIYSSDTLKFEEAVPRYFYASSKVKISAANGASYENQFGSKAGYYAVNTPCDGKINFVSVRLGKCVKSDGSVMKLSFTAKQNGSANIVIKKPNVCTVSDYKAAEIQLTGLSAVISRTLTKEEE